MYYSDILCALPTECFVNALEKASMGQVEN